MINEKRIYLCEQQANRLWSAVMGLGQEAARAGDFGKGYAVVAHEARFVAEKLLDCIAKARFDGADEELFAAIEGFALELGYLAVNGELEILRIVNTDNTMSNNKAMMVVVNELQEIAFALADIAGKEIWQKHSVMAEVANPIKSIRARAEAVRFTLSGIAVAEDCRNVQEVLYSPKMDTSGKNLTLRGQQLPIINLYKQFNLTPPADNQNAVAIIKYSGKTFAVPMDRLDINPIFFSLIGQNTTPDANNPFANHTRECWDAVGGGQLIFIDWGKML
ncbi:MAG: chemotaxis protein CheW [Defluviitaleaceae bacterium]|nr:chemotaxis protein CheW [Defluviitaleaceae bacterium]